MSQAWKAYPNVTGKDYRSPANLPNLELHDVPKPSPGAKEALVRVRAVSLNARDLMVTAFSHLYPIRTAPGLTPCSDGAGVVEAAGPTSAWKVGDRVVLPQNSWGEGTDVQDYKLEKSLGGGEEQGTLRQYIVVGDERLIKAPEGLTFEEMCCLPCAGLTAFNVLNYHPGWTLREGEWVLTQGTGGVSTMGIQLAVAAGANVIATSSSNEKLELAKRLGAKHTINYRETPEWSQEALKITGGRGVDFVLEVGGAGTLEETLKSLRQGGGAGVCGILSAPKEIDVVPYLLFGAKTLRGVLGAGSRDMLVKLVRQVEKHDIHPVIAKTFEWAEAKEAFAMMMNQNEVGKIVIKV